MRRAAWLVLALLLAATLAGAATFDRRSWPSLVGDEATYLMAAASLAWDQDLRYERADYDRFFGRWGVRPDGLILQSHDGGKTLVYGKPAAYSVVLAPFVRISPARGPWVANALLLVAAAWASAWALQRRLGPAAALWVAAFLFASVTFAYVFWAHADLFLACLVAIALALVYGGAAGGRSARRSETRRPPVTPRRAKAASPLGPRCLSHRGASQRRERCSPSSCSRGRSTRRCCCRRCSWRRAAAGGGPARRSPPVS